MITAETLRYYYSIGYITKAQGDLCFDFMKKCQAHNINPEEYIANPNKFLSKMPQLFSELSQNKGDMIYAAIKNNDLKLLKDLAVLENAQNNRQNNGQIRQVQNARQQQYRQPTQNVVQQQHTQTRQVSNASQQLSPEQLNIQRLFFSPNLLKDAGYTDQQIACYKMFATQCIRLARDPSELSLKTKELSDGFFIYSSFKHRNLDINKQSQQTRTNTSQSSRSTSQQMPKSKVYALGDVHGMYGAYAEALNRLSPNDELVILGDVIDRGPDGIRILEDLVLRTQNRKPGPKITFMVGNHEDLLMNNLKKINSSPRRQEIVNLIKNYHDTRMFLVALPDNDPRKRQLLDIKETYKKEFAKLGISPYDQLVTDILRNGQDTTLSSFYKLPLQNRQKIIEFIQNSPIALAKAVNNKPYLFVHSMPPYDKHLLQKLYHPNATISYNDPSVSYEQKKYTLCQRSGQGNDDMYAPDSSYDIARQIGFYKSVCGHTTSYDVIKDDTYVRIDLGCGHGSQRKLALYCVSDDSVELFTPSTYEQYAAKERQLQANARQRIPTPQLNQDAIQNPKSIGALIKRFRDSEFYQKLVEEYQKISKKLESKKAQSIGE